MSRVDGFILFDVKPKLEQLGQLQLSYKYINCILLIALNSRWGFASIIFGADFNKIGGLKYCQSLYGISNECFMFKN